MSRAFLALSVCAALSCATPVRAQQRSPFQHVSPSQVTFQPIDTSRSVAPPAMLPGRSRFASFFSNLVPSFLKPGSNIKPAAPTSTTVPANKGGIGGILPGTGSRPGTDH